MVTALLIVLVLVCVAALVGLALLAVNGCFWSALWLMSGNAGQLGGLVGELLAVIAARLGE
jgi:hypothetical protein